VNTFESPSGRDVLADLTRSYADRQSYVQGDPGETAFNEGQRSVVRRIKSMLHDLNTEAIR
jgi:hypothetical protein